MKIDKLFSNIPKEREDPFQDVIKAAYDDRLDTTIVLDDDPTGTQTVHGIPVLTNWSEEAIAQEFQKKTRLFYILTNSRSLESAQAEHLAYEIGQNIRKAAIKYPVRYWVISRSDSTLRGHYPGEVDALELGLNYSKGVHFIIPAFFEGGRYTLNDTHYVHKDGQLIPAAETPYAKDKVFGYHFSNLKSWVEEKTQGSVPATEVATISLTELRQEAPTNLIQKINQLETGSICVVNAVAYSDLKCFTLALLQSNIQPVLRTAASFVAALAHLNPQPLLKGTEVITPGNNGALIIVGSFVPVSTQQLQDLFQSKIALKKIEIPVREIVQEKQTTTLLESLILETNQAIQSGVLVVLYTSRELISTSSSNENQQIGQKISQFIVQVVKNLQERPTYILTKGGITSSDIATKALGVKRALVAGQIKKGIPVWKLGTETKFPGISQIIFPGNVGTEKSLTEIVKTLMQ